jgi:hypothetical protein
MDSLESIHEAQLMSYIKSYPVAGLACSSTATVLEDGLRRIVNDFPDSLRFPRPLR